MRSVTSTLIPMRLSDLDALNHVNNVVYVEYAMEAREASGLPEADTRTSTTVVEFKRPILLSRTPINVSTETDAKQIRQEIRVGDGTTVFATVTSELGAADPVEPEVRATERSLSLRYRDARTGAVNMTRWFELFQETRVDYLSTLVSSMSAGRFVVARTEVTPIADLAWRAEPLPTRSWIERVGNASITVASQIIAEDSVVAHSRTVLVGFDLAAQSSRTFADEEKAEFAQGLL